MCSSDLGLGLVGTTGVLFVRRTKRRVAALEKALGPERVMSIEEAEIPVQMREEILTSLDWLKELQGQIPTLDTTVLFSVRAELQNAHELYARAFGDIMEEDSLTDPGLRLKQTLVERVNILISAVEKELNARA